MEYLNIKPEYYIELASKDISKEIQRHIPTTVD